MPINAAGKPRGDHVDTVLIKKHKRAEIRLTQTQGLLQHRVEHRREVARRGIDDLQYLGSRSLLVQRLARLGQEPRILHRDDRLVGKGAHQLDLPFGERLEPVPREIDCAEHGPLAQQRHPEYGSSPGRHSLGQRVVWVGGDVLDMHDPAFERHPPGDAIAAWSNGALT